jgi:hypothetical protein
MNVLAMNFGEAMLWLLQGARVRRKDWNRPAYIDKITLKSELSERKIGQDVYCFSQIVMVMKNGKVNAYTPSQCDMNADDWVLYNDSL